jgi:hypothetical protein
MSDKPGFMQKSVMRDKESHDMLIKEIIQQEDITMLNTCALNIGASNSIIPTFLSLKEQIGPDIITARDLNTPLFSIGRAYRKKKSTKIS